jgi:MFS transporter, UMF1 family
MYDWANSAFVTTIITAVFPPFFQNVAGKNLDSSVATSRFAFTTTAALACVAVLGPLLGAAADSAPIKKRLLGFFMGVGVLATVAMATIAPGQWQWALIAFAIGNIGVGTSFVFYDSLLPHLANNHEVDRVSTAGYALGYVGGGLLLMLNLAMIQKPELFGLADTLAGIRLSFISVAVWWVVFSVPLFRRVPEPPVLAASPSQSLVRRSFRNLAGTARELRSYRHAFVFLVAFLLYNDGIQTIIRMAAIYAAELHIGQGTLIAAILAVQFIGIPFAFAFGQLAAVVGSKRAIFIGLGVYMFVSAFAYFISTAVHFWILAVLIGMVQGGTQALSRSVFASMIPRAKSAEFFGVFAVFEKFAGIFGPLLFGLAVWLTGSTRLAVVSVMVFFVAGGLLLATVDIDAGRRQVAEPEPGQA